MLECAVMVKLTTGDMRFSHPLGRVIYFVETLLSVLETSISHQKWPVYRIVSYITCKHKKKYVVDKLLILRGWQHQLAILRENGSLMAYDTYNLTLILLFFNVLTLLQKRR